MKLKRCPNCKKYTFKNVCPKCGKIVKDAHYKYLKVKDAPKSSLRYFKKG